MKVILLAAGRSQRVKPIEDKNFLRFCGKTLIEHQLEALRQAGFRKIIIVGGAHNLEKLQGVAKQIKTQHPGLSLDLVEQKNLEEGMAGAVLAAKSHVEEQETIAIVSTNDVIAPEAYKQMFEAAKDPVCHSFLLAKLVKEYFPGGYLKMDAQHHILGIVEKPGPGNEPSDLVNLVFHIHKNSKALIEALEATHSSRDDRYEKALDTLIQQGIKMKAVPYEGFWQPIKYPWHVWDVAHFYFKEALKQGKGISTQAQLQERVTIKGDVIIEEGAKVFSGATVVGPVYLGKGTVVATNALVRESFLGENSVVGYNTEVARSVMGDHVWTHSNYIGDSLIGNDVSFGAGTITGNLRFDEKNIEVAVGDERVDSGKNKLGIITGDHIRVGVNTSFMPGIKIGSHAMVAAGIVVDRDIPASTFVQVDKPEWKMIPNRNSEGIIPRAPFCDS